MALCHLKSLAQLARLGQVRCLSAGAIRLTAKEETIGDFFVTLEGGFDYEPTPDIIQRKDEIHPGTDTAQAIFDDVTAALHEHKTNMTRPGFDLSQLVPVVDMSEVLTDAAIHDTGFLDNPMAIVDQLDRDALAAKGCVVLRNVITPAEIKDMRTSLFDYLDANRGKWGGFPADDPQVYEIYWSKAQVAARQHPKVVQAMQVMNSMWTTAKPEVDGDPTACPTIYCDRLRVRQPGDAKFALGPHVDGGSLERWLDPEYWHTYSKVFENWREYDPLDYTHRVNANMDMFGAANACSAFRAWQGWLSLSNCQPGEGTLKVMPFLRESTTHMMVRPFLQDIPAGIFPGAFPGRGQDINPEYHDILTELTISLPHKIQPGDMVFWHCDLIHAVESQHGGSEDASVFFIPACPRTAGNVEYAKGLYQALEAGHTPADFPQTHAEQDFKDRATVEDLSPLGRLLHGQE